MHLPFLSFLNLMAADIRNKKIMFKVEIEIEIEIELYGKWSSLGNVIA